MVTTLPRRFIEITRERGLRSALSSTVRYLTYKTHDIRRGIYLRFLRLRVGESLIREINGSDMKLDLRSDSPNKIERTLAVKGIREPGATETFRDVLIELKRKRTSSIHVFDIGANIGYFALLEANILGDQGKIYAIEAEPNNADRLKHNVKLNNYSNIEVLQIAIGAEETQLELAQRSSSNVHRMKSILGDKQAVGTVDVEVYPLDSLIAEKAIPEDELIIVRMDIEGYEGQAFEGMSELLSSDRPVYIFAEIHPNVEGVNPEQIADRLTQNGFHPEYVSYNGGNDYKTMDSLDEIRSMESNGHLMVRR